jgi:hypothetical protein
MLDSYKELYLAKLDEISALSVSDHGKGEQIIGLLNQIASQSSWDYAVFMQECRDHGLLTRLAHAKDDVSTNYFREWLPQAMQLAALVRKMGTAESAERLLLARELMTTTRWNGWFTTILGSLMRERLEHHTGARDGYARDVIDAAARLIALEPYSPEAPE